MKDLIDAATWMTFQNALNRKSQTQVTTFYVKYPEQADVYRQKVD